MESSRNPWGVHGLLMWSPQVHVDSTGTPHGLSMESMWTIGNAECSSAKIYGVCGNVWGSVKYSQFDALQKRWYNLQSSEQFWPHCTCWSYRAIIETAHRHQTIYGDWSARGESFFTCVSPWYRIHDLCSSMDNLTVWEWSGDIECTATFGRWCRWKPKLCKKVIFNRSAFQTHRYIFHSLDDPHAFDNSCWLHEPKHNALILLHKSKKPNSGELNLMFVC